MISSKKINLISVILIIIACLFCVGAMLYRNFTTGGNENLKGEKSYGENHSVYFGEEDYSDDDISCSVINLTDGTTESTDVKFVGKSIEILSGGTYELTGTLEDGCVIVNAQDGVTVRLILNAAHITSSDFGALYIEQAKKTIISSVEGTVNTISDAANQSGDFGYEAPLSAVFSRDDVTFNGKGTIIISGNAKDGLKVNDGLKIMSGTLEIKAEDDAVNVNNYVAVADGNVKIESGGDGIKCGKENDAEKGFIAIEGGSVDLHTGGDGIYAMTDLYINSATANVTSGGGAVSEMPESGMPMRRGFEIQSEEDTVSTKALKADGNIVVNSGNYTLNSKEDAIHANGDITINGGMFDITADDDAVHSDGKLILNSGGINVKKSFEGFEGGEIEINDGTYNVVASDDGINAAGYSQNGSMSMNMSRTVETYLTVNGGKLYIESGGDGLDSNGAAVVNGGYVEVFGPENNGNSSLDFERNFTINGGTVIAAGSSGMAEKPAEASKSNIIVVNSGKSFSAGDTITLKDSSGNDVVQSVPTKKYNWICIAAPEIKSGEIYSVCINDESIGEAHIEGVVTQIESTAAAEDGADNNGDMQAPQGRMGGRRMSGENMPQPPDGNMPQPPDGGMRGGRGGEPPQMRENGKTPPEMNGEMPNERMAPPQMPRGNAEGNIPQGGMHGRMNRMGFENEMKQGIDIESVKEIVLSNLDFIVSLLILIFGLIFVVIYRRKRL